MYRYLCQYDCLTFFHLVSSLYSTEKAMQSAGWMLLGAADALFVESKLRAFGPSGTSPLKKLKISQSSSQGSEGPEKADAGKFLILGFC